MKFYTEEGNWDLVGNNTPIFFIRDPILVGLFPFISVCAINQFSVSDFDSPCNLSSSNLIPLIKLAEWEFQLIDWEKLKNDNPVVKSN